MYLTKIRVHPSFLHTSSPNCFQASRTSHTEICFVSISAKFDICTVVGLNGTLVEAKIRPSSVPSAYFSI